MTRRASQARVMAVQADAAEARLLAMKVLLASGIALSTLLALLLMTP